MTDRTREHVDAFWSMIDGVLNAVLFLLLGLEVFAVECWSEVLLPALLAVLDLPGCARYLSRGARHGDAGARIAATRVGADIDLERPARRHFGRAGALPAPIFGHGNLAGEHVCRRRLLRVGAGPHRKASAGPSRSL